MKNKGTLVSFFGSRGSGKTTVAQLVCMELEQHGRSCVRQHSGLKRHPVLPALLTAVGLWRFFDWELMTVLGFRGRARRWWPSIYRLYLPLAFAHDLHQLLRGRTDILVYDSNILRGLISGVARGEIEPTSIANFYSRKVLPCVTRLVLVVLETDPATAVERWITRDRVQLSETERSSEITDRIHQQVATSKVIDALEVLPGVSIIRLDGNASAETNAARVVAMLERS